jgi:uncharacterized Zn finger protein (UPF0148 family)
MNAIVIRPCPHCATPNLTEAGRPTYCRVCRHRADLARTVCDCTECRLRAELYSPRPETPTITREAEEHEHGG